ncbi:PspC domain-containing protein [Bifidobacterium sp. ESL0745]|uniref:PspC domain-containing protein n=1 Tax=Bifidobacterium sp. ESL0745 TaxID=2983226 RepID=UPI0023F79DF4|nr:PspC domain-containing protein [Bifidobacterium sp. ESL0745]MDF7665413.1 PspC domain-containing protein [Bifidobacterium sp. ESL0745]
MSNNTFGSGYQQPNDMSNSVPPRHDKVDRFFAWIRGSGLMRGNNRWIAGVCDGIAVRYGLSPVFVRAIVAASTLVCGFGAAFYAAAWVLLPDCRDGRISGEELVYGHWQWSLLGPIIFMVIAFCFPGIGVLLAVIAVVVLLVMVNSLANKAQQQRGAAYTNNPQQGQYQGQAQRPQGRYQTGSMPYSPSGNVNPTFYWNANSAPYVPQSWQQTQGGPQAGTQQTRGNNEATFREPENVKQNSGFDGADADADQNESGVKPNALRDAEGHDSFGDGATAQNRSGDDAEPHPFGDSNHVYSAGSPSAGGSQCNQRNERPNVPGFNGQPSSPFAAGPSPAYAAPPTYMAEPAQPYRQGAAQVAAKTWGQRRTRRKPAGFVVVLLTLGAVLLSGALVAIQCFNNGGFMGTIFQYGTYWIGGILIFLGVIIAVLGLTGHRAGGLHPLVWIAAFVAVVFIVGDIGYSSVLTGLEQESVSYHNVNVSGFKAIDGSDDQQLKRLKQGTAIKGHRLDDDAVNIDFSDYAKTRGTHDVTLKDGSTVQSSCPTGTIRLTDSQATVFVTLPAGCSYGLSHESNARVDGSRVEIDNADGAIIVDGVYAGSEIGTRSLGSGYVAIGRDMQVGIGGMSYQRIGYGSGYGYDQDYQWFTETKKMPKNGPELVIDAPYIVEGRVSVQYPAESTVPSYAQFVKGKTTGTWRR